MTTYLDDPATALLATDCAVCNRPLRDAVSVEAGSGPDCRKRHGYGQAQGEADWTAVESVLAAHSDLAAVLAAHRGDAHRLANVLVHRAACAHRDERAPHVQAVGALGFTVLAAALARGAGEVVEVEPYDGRLAVKTPFNETFNALVSSLRIGARWDREAPGRRRPGAVAAACIARAAQPVFADARRAGPDRPAGRRFLKPRRLQLPDNVVEINPAQARPPKPFTMCRP